MRQNTSKSAKRRLALIEGQVKGITRMVDESRYCIDIVRQIQAVKAALVGLEGLVLEDHLETCVETALQSEDVQQRREKVEELVAVLGGRKK
jgi:DNA-binding FrmR family transcriptional regulator